MPTIVALLIASLALVSCQSAPEPQPQVPAEPVQTSSPDAGIVRDMAEPVVRATDVPVGLDESVEVLPGFTVTWTGRSHKHGKGFTTGIWHVSLTDGDQTEDLEFRSHDELWAEGLSFGYVWRVGGTYEALTISAAKPDGEPLTEDGAREKLREHFGKMGLAECPSSASSVDSGVLHLTCRVDDKVVAEGQIGMFTYSVDARLTSGESGDPDL